MASVLTLARNAMATRFEIVMHGAPESRLRSAGEEALDEIERLEAQLSIYRADSELSVINRRAASEAVRVEPRLFALLERAYIIAEKTKGAFDITIYPLSRCWGFMTSSGSIPSPEKIEAARAITGYKLLDLDRKHFTARFTKNGVMLDLGSIGKGYAVDRARTILLEAGIENALIHGGTSTTAVLGIGPDGQRWRVGIQAPPENEGSVPEMHDENKNGRSRILSTVELTDEALSVSAVWGKAFKAEGRLLGHIIDPRTGWPACNSVLSAAVCENAADSDAYSTALLVGEASDIFPEDGIIRRQLTCKYRSEKLTIQSQGI